jgi:hypothetical protein
MGARGALPIFLTGFGHPHKAVANRLKGTIGSIFVGTAHHGFAVLVELFGQGRKAAIAGDNYKNF